MRGKYDSIRHMKRTTIFIPEELEAELQGYARRAKKPTAWVVREAVSTFLAAHRAPATLPSSIGKGASGRADVSERFEDLLFDDLAPTSAPVAAPAPPRRPRTGRVRRSK